MPLSNREVAVVEDDEGMSQAIERILVADGCRVVRYGSAEALLDQGSASRMDCLVIDVRLPGISGLELYRRLLDAGRVPPCVFMTGFDNAAVREQVHQAQAAGYLVKPFAGRALIDAVCNAVATPSRA